MIIAVAAWKLCLLLIDRKFRQDGGAVVALLPMEGEIVAERLEFEAREGMVLAFGLLEERHIGRGLLEPVDHGLDPGLDAVNVPGGDEHANNPSSSPPCATETSVANPVSKLGG